MNQLTTALAIAAMQSINVVVLNRSFLGVLMGTAAIASALTFTLGLIGGTNV